VSRIKRLRNLAHQALAENNIDVLENYVLKDRAEKKRKRKTKKASQKRNRSKQ